MRAVERINRVATTHTLLGFGSYVRLLEFVTAASISCHRAHHIARVSPYLFPQHSVRIASLNTLLYFFIEPRQVRVMYTPLMGDEKRDIVEYTSFGFMNCAHTMLTYTRAMDSALCVPLMIDAAVWCDYFAREGTSQDRVSRALAYLFKVPEGGAQGVDPGFFRQMRALEDELEATRVGTPVARGETAREVEGRRSVVPDVATMLTGRVVCAGISCLDLQLCGSGGAGGGVETIRKFEETKYCPGGSCPQASTALAQLGVPGVVAVTKMGVDAHGDEMVRQVSAAAVAAVEAEAEPAAATTAAAAAIPASPAVAAAAAAVVAAAAALLQLETF